MTLTDPEESHQYRRRLALRRGKQLNASLEYEQSIVGVSGFVVILASIAVLAAVVLFLFFGLGKVIHPGAS